MSRAVRSLIVAVLALAAAAGTAAKASAQQPPPPSPREAPPLVALVGDAGFLTGVAAGAQLDLRRIGLRATAGYMPLLVALVTTEGETVDFNFFNTAQLNVELFSLFLEPTPTARVGAALSYRYNTLLQHGAGAAFDALVTLRRRLALHVAAGLTVYPRGNGRVEREIGPFVEASFPGPEVQGTASVGLVFGLF